MIRGIFLALAIAFMRASRAVHPPSTAIVIAATSLSAGCEAPVAAPAASSSSSSSSSSVLCCVYSAVVSFVVILSTGFLLNATKRFLATVSVNVKPP